MAVITSSASVNLGSLLNTVSAGLCVHTLQCKGHLNVVNEEHAASRMCCALLTQPVNLDGGDKCSDTLMGVVKPYTLHPKP